MRGVVRRLVVVGFACGVVGLVGSSAVAVGDGVAAEGQPAGGGSGGSLSLGGAPAVSGALGSGGGEPVSSTEAVKPASPEALATRKESGTEYENLNPEQVAKVAGEAFPTVVDAAAGGPPSLPTGQKILGFASGTAAQVDLGGGRRGVIESMEPMAVETSSGHYAPIDLSLGAAGSSFEPKTPEVGVVIPKRLGAGVQLPALATSLTPVDTQGASVGGAEGVVDGQSVLYANTQTDADTLVKPTTGGFEADTLLRSVESPEDLYFRIGLPEGGKLVQSEGGPVKVMVEGAAVAVIRPPSARDAAGTPVPVSMSVKGDVLTLAVASHGGEYQWPIEVDPEVAKVEDNSFGPTECHKAGEAERQSSNWCWFSNSAAFKATWYSGKAVELWNEGTVGAGGYTGMGYHTQGESKIYEVEAYTDGSVYKSVAKLEFARKRTVEAGEVEASTELEKNGYKEFGNTKFCVSSECSTSAGSFSNIVAYKLEAEEPLNESYDIDSGIQNTNVYISQEKAPEPSFNTTESEVEVSPGVKRLNALYGERWLGPYTNTAFEVKAHDPGIGISWGRVGLGSYSLEEPIYEDGKCNGVQCNENYRTAVTYGSSMVEGEQSIQWYAADLAGRPCGSCNGLSSEATHPVKVDAKPPSKFEVGGWPATREISAAVHTLTASATDEGPSGGRSSGVKSISVAVDGGPETTVADASCSPGTCTGSGKYTLDAKDMTEGVHRLVVTATDNADNVAAKEFTFDVRHASPVSVGPGSVDPSTGQFKLSANDVSLAGAGGVSRVYESRDLTAGVEGPLGPQWAVSLGGGEGLTVLPSGSVVLEGSSGGSTTFTRNSKGEFESPLGDGNLKVEAKEPVKGKGIAEYLLLDATAGTTTRFTQPPGSQSTTPVYATEFGAEGAQLSHPVSDAVDGSGNVWATDYGNNRIEKFSSAGVLIAAYGSVGSENEQFKAPWGIAVNQSSGNVYVTDQGNNRVEELSSTGGFVRAFGSYGTGGGQVNVEAGVAVDSSGNVWVADYGNNRIEEFNAEGKFLMTFGFGVSNGESKLESCTSTCQAGIAGSGSGQLNGPFNVAFSGGNLYVTDYHNNRVQEFSIAGAYIAQFGSGGSGNGQFTDPYGIASDPVTGNLYVSDYGNTRVQEFTAAGAFVAKFGAAGTGAGQFGGPTGVAVNTTGGVYVDDYANNRVEEWTHPSWLPTLAEGALKSGTTTYAYEAVETTEGTKTIEPIEALAPVPAGVSCGTKPEELKEASKKGCRALTFEYAHATTATGEGPGEWGNYKGRLERVEFHAWDPSKGEMSKEKFVAQYSYDTKGRLRAEWDPRISPALKTIYGYDPEGHLTAINQAGQQPWLLHYGTTETDPSPGQLLSVTRPNAATALGEDLAPVNTEAPKLSTTSPVEGTEVTALNGTWSHSPLSYGYQWESCSATGTECAIIPGAVNQGYTPRYSDEEHTLAVLVTATNAGGSATAATVASSVVPVGFFPPTYSTSFGSEGTTSGKFKSPSYITVDEYEWPRLDVTDTGNNRVEEFDTSGTYWGSFGSSGKGEEALKEPTGIVAGREGTYNYLWVADSGDHRVKDYLNGNEYDRSTKLPGTGALGGMSGTDGEEQVVNSGEDQIEWIFTSVWGLSHEGHFGSLGTGNGQLKSPSAIADGAEQLYVADTGNNRVQEFTYGGSYFSQFGEAGSKQGQLKEPKGIAVDSKGDIWVVDTGNNRVEVFTAAGKYLMQFGSAGTGAGQFKEPKGIAFDSSNNVYVVDSGNDRVEKWVPGKRPADGPLPPASPPVVGTSAVETVEYHVPVSGSGAPYSLGSGEIAKWGQKDEPTEGVAVFPADEPMGWPASKYTRATIHYWDAEGRTVNTVVPSGGVATSEYNETNDVTRALSADNRAAALKEGSKSAEASEKLDTKSVYSAGGAELLETIGPEHGIKRAGGGEVQARDHVKYYYDEGAKEVEEKTHETYGLVTKTEDFGETASKEKFDERVTKTSYSGQENLGWKLRKPTSVTTDPGALNLTSTTKYEEATGNVLETQSPAAAGGDAKVPPAYGLQFGAKGTGNAQFEGPEHDALDSHGDVWVADYANHRVEELSSTGTFMLAVGWGVKDGKAEAETCTTSCKAGISGTGSGQLEGPFGIAVNQTSNNVYVADYLANRIEEFSSTGAYVASFGAKGTAGGQFGSPEGVALDASGDVWVADSANNRIQELSSTGTFMLAVGWGVKDGKAEAETCAASCEAGVVGSGNGQFSAPSGVAFSGGNVYVSDYGNNRVDELSTAGTYVSKFGSKGTAAGQFEGPAGIAAEAAAGDLLVADSGNDRVQKFSAAGALVAAFGAKGSGNGQLLLPTGVAVNATGGVYVVDRGNDRVQEWVPAVTGNEGAHDSKTIYYSTAPNSEYKGCGEHPEWANLPCETKPVAQSGVSGLPELPITTVTYNLWDEVERTEEAFGSTKRVKTQTYDAAGRAWTSEETSTVDTALPEVTNEYSPETGALVKQSTTTGEKTKAITSAFNSLGQLTSYTDADGNTTTYEYEKEKDARLVKTSYTIEKEGFSQTYAYNATTGAMQELTDASTGTDPAAGKFTATYDVEGKMLTETYPNNMTATYISNAAGQTTGLVYEKNADCVTKCPETWFSDSVTPSVHGETLAQTSTLAKDSYAYDKAGRLTETQETPTGKGCVSRLYGYDEEGNRTTLTKRESATETCAGEGGNTEWHTYDTANRPTDPGIAYEALGNTTTLPAADAGEHALTSSYYVDGQVASQTQNGETINYGYDPAGRTRETVSTGKTAATVIDHYAGPGEALAWSSEGTEKWTRNIPGIDGALDAIQTNAGIPVLQLHDLQGNIVATVKDSEAETKLGSTYNSTEFGVPQPGTTPPKYAWLGADGLGTELSSGTATKGGASYVPQVARNLQTAPVVPPGAFPNGTGTGSQYDSEIPGWYISLSNAESAATIAEYAAKQEALRKKAEQEALETEERIHREEAEDRPAPTEGGAEEVEAEEEGEEEGEPSASAARSRSRYGSYKGRVSEQGGGLFGSSLGSYELWINASWGGYAGGEITSHNIDCGWNPGIWQASESSCTYRHKANNSQIVVKFYITFSFIRGLSSASRRIYCSMRIASEGYNHGGCKILSQVGG